MNQSEANVYDQNSGSTSHIIYEILILEMTLSSDHSLSKPLIYVQCSYDCKQCPAACSTDSWPTICNKTPMLHTQSVIATKTIGQL